MDVAEVLLRQLWGPWAELSRDELYAILALRQQVFVVEQHCVYLDADGRDPDAWHLRWQEGPALLAYLRAFSPDEAGEARIGRVITAPAVRGTGLGRPLMQAGLDAVFSTFGPCPVRIEAQSHLAAYYGSLGFEIVGEEYLDDGIPHLPMRREISAGRSATPPLP
jgi:ElaA protein